MTAFDPSGVSRLAAVALVAAAVFLWLPSPGSARVRSVVRDEPPLRSGLSELVRALRDRLTRGSGFGPASRRRAALERVRAIQALGALAAELESGQPPRAAMRRAGGEPSVWPAALGAAHMDGDVAAALSLDARRRPVLAQLAACWQVGADSGAGLALAVARLSASARAAEDVRIDLEGQLAGPRATARLLAVLPVVGIGFGTMLGSDPLSWLLTSMPGRACLAAGLTLTALGTWWTGRIANRVERML